MAIVTLEQHNADMAALRERLAALAAQARQALDLASHHGLNHVTAQDFVNFQGSLSILHNILSATHGDAVGAVAVATGALIYGNATPKWDTTIGTTHHLEYQPGTLALGYDGSPRLDFVGYGGGTNIPNIRFLTAQGTMAAPTSSLLGDYVEHSFCGFRAGAKTGARIRAVVNQNYAVGAQGMRIEVYTTPDGQATALLVFTFKANGDLDVAQNILMASGKTVDGVDVSALSTSVSDHLADAADAHDASAISILDTAADFAATDVEGALAELQADNEAHAAAADGHPDHTVAVHTGIIGETTWQLLLPLTKPLPAATNNATLDDDWLYKSIWTNEAIRINNWYIRFESNLAANATFQLKKNGTQITGAEITVSAAARDAAVDAFTETTLADGDVLEVVQTAGNAEDIGGKAYIYGDQDVVAAVTY